MNNCPYGYEFVKAYRKSNGEYVRSFCRKKIKEDDTERGREEAINKIKQKLKNKKSVYVRTLNGEYKLGMHDELINVEDTSNIRSHNYVYVPVGSLDILMNKILKRDERQMERKNKKLSKLKNKHGGSGDSGDNDYGGE